MTKFRVHYKTANGQTGIEECTANDKRSAQDWFKRNWGGDTIERIEDVAEINAHKVVSHLVTWAAKESSHPKVKEYGLLIKAAPAIAFEIYDQYKYILNNEELDTPYEMAKNIWHLMLK